MEPYCHSRFQTKRWKTRAVNVGGVCIGGDNPIRVQSMTTTDTCDVDATIRQTIELAEAGCEIVRITAPTLAAGRALGEIRKGLIQAKVAIPLVADIHLLPKVAMEAVNHVDKVRINPGNYADRKTFKIREYSDDQYDEEMERLHEAFSPIVLRTKELGKAMRIGTNHGSLSDRIMNRYGDSPLGMVESALEFIRIAKSHGFHDIILSMKASNPKVMIEAYRLAVSKMKSEGMAYPLHLGVTEAGDGEDARIKSTIGIGTLLYDGLGDTIRVSLTEDPVYEVPVARALAEHATILRNRQFEEDLSTHDSINPFEFNRRISRATKLGTSLRPLAAGATATVPVWVRPDPNLAGQELINAVCHYQIRYKDNPVEGLILKTPDPETLIQNLKIAEALQSTVACFVLEVSENLDPQVILEHAQTARGLIFSRTFTHADEIAPWHELTSLLNATLAINSTAENWQSLLAKLPTSHVIAGALIEPNAMHALGQYRQIVETLRGREIPLWIRLNADSHIYTPAGFSDRLMESALLAGPLLCDGLGDILSVETVTNLPQAVMLGYNILQGARVRISKTEYVACPSCGRTLFDLQTTTARVKEKTSHLKGVTIAVMGCIVNGPGEMADADFGYVGGAPGKINLYVGKKCVKNGIPSEFAVDELVSLIKEHGKWVEQEPVLA